MSHHVVIALLIESALIAVTTILLAKPRFVFANPSPNVRTVTTVAGMIMLCVLFMWSVVFGCVLSINAISFYR